MGLLSRMIKVWVLIMMVSACATAILQIPEKYDLDMQLEQVKEVADLRLGNGRRPGFTIFNESFEDPLTVMNRRDLVMLSRSKHHWIRVDQQSLIIRTGTSEYHLLVLRRPAPELMFSDDISFVCPTKAIRAGLDVVQLQNNMSYVIDRIYKINSHEQMYFIRDQLIGKNKEEPS